MDNTSSQIKNLYENLISSWNTQNANNFAALFASDGISIGFDGSQMNNAEEIEKSLSQIFANHKTARYVTIVKEIKSLAEDVALLRSVVGMVPPEEDDIKPDVNAIQSLIAKKQNDNWVIALFQNTPAAFHGRPELSEELTNELRDALKVQNN